MFSRRTQWDLTPNALTVAIHERRVAGRIAVDLSASNPTQVALTFSDETLARVFSTAALGSYDPDPRGGVRAREAVSAYYASRGLHVDPSHLVLTASTSEAYGWLFKILCDPGDEVLVLRPSYPLVDELARVENVVLRSVAFHWHGRWELDLDAMRAAFGPRTRAVMLVHPNNPTGSFVTRDERDALATLCATHDVALVVDEVFGDYAWCANPRLAPSFVEEHRALTFTLSGISKVLCLPQMKLGWIAVSGPEALRDAALARIETLADCYLSVASPVQRALPWLFAEREFVQGAVMARVVQNLRALDAAIGVASPVQRLTSDGGWYAVLQVPATRSDDAWVLHLLDTTGCLTQPGWLFDFARPGYLVLSLLPDPVLFADAIVRVVQCVERDVA